MSPAIPGRRELVACPHSAGLLGFRVVRRGNHISLVRENADGTRVTMTLPAHSTIKSSTLRTACTQAGIARKDFLEAYLKTSR